MLDSPLQENDDTNNDNTQSANIWIEYQDDEGRTYYYNEVTQESAWDIPEGAIVQQPPAEDDDEEEEQEEKKILEDDNHNGEDVDVDMDDNSGDKGDVHGGDDLSRHEDANDLQDKDDINATRAEEGQEENSIEKAPVWTKYQDDEGRDYYYNALTGQTQWERPDDFVEGNNDDNFDNDYAEQGEQKDHQQQTVSSDLHNDSNRNKTSFDASEKYKDLSNITSSTFDPHEEEEEQSSLTTGPKEPSSITQETQPNNSSSTAPPSSLSPTASSKQPPSMSPLEVAEQFLSQPDAVLEPEATTHLLTLAEGKGAEVALKTLVSSYMNQTAICGVLCKWLVDAKTVNEKDGSSSSSSKGGMNMPKGSVAAGAFAAVEAFDVRKLHTIHAESIRQMMEEVIGKIAKTNFTEEAQQRMLHLTKKERLFFDEMMEHERWRRLLIDLSAEYKDSVLLTLLLKSISKRGYHREIAKRINQSDYFEVFHGMLSSELVLLGKLGVNGGRDISNELSEKDNIETILDDLKRQSTTNEYTYVYVLELLDELIEKSKTRVKNLSGPKAVGLSRATNKWERLREEIFKHMIKASENSASLNPLLRKRRADIALTSSELYQRQRRKVRMLGNAGNRTEEYDKIRYSVESGVVNLLKKYSMNTNIDDGVLNQLLYNPYSDKSLGTEQSQEILGKLLHKYSLATEHLLRSLFVTSARIKSSEMRLKCCKLVAMAALAGQKDLKAQIDLDDSSDSVQEEQVSTMAKVSGFI